MYEIRCFWVVLAIYRQMVVCSPQVYAAKFQLIVLEGESFKMYSQRFGIQYCSPDGDGSWRHESSKGCTKTLKLQPGTTAFSLVYTPPAQGERCQLMPYVSPTTGKPEEKGRIRLEDLKLEEIAQEKPQQPQKEGKGS